MNPQWLTWAQQIQAIAQNGLAYCDNVYDIERYEQLQALAVEILATHTATDPVRLLDLFRAEAGYATPKVDVRGAVFQAGKLLLVQERSDGGWTLPGGWADVGDSPATAVVREIEEESGYQTRATKLVAVYDRDHPRHGHPPLAYHVYKLFFHCEIIGGAPRKSIETSNVGFFGADELPTLSLTRVVPGQIARLFAHLADPTLPTDFD
ncbi:MAG: NUDIX hydrolase [Caldilineaceae bacterium]